MANGLMRWRNAGGLQKMPSAPVRKTSLMKHTMWIILQLDDAKWVKDVVRKAYAVIEELKQSADRRELIDKGPYRAAVCARFTTITHSRRYDLTVWGRLQPKLNLRHSRYRCIPRTGAVAKLAPKTRQRRF